MIYSALAAGVARICGAEFVSLLDALGPPDLAAPHVEAALDLGYHGCAVLRSGGIASVPTITNLCDLLAPLD